jgi:hypothetical protein
MIVKLMERDLKHIYGLTGNGRIIMSIENELNGLESKANNHPHFPPHPFPFLLPRPYGVDGHVKDDAVNITTRDSNPGPIFSIPGFGI